MATGSILTVATGWVAIATGISVILAVISLILMATVNVKFGPINDTFNGIIGISSLALAWLLSSEFNIKSPLVTFSIALIGAIFIVIGSVLVLFKFTGYVLAAWYSGFGNAMIGLWVVIFCYLLLPDEIIAHKLAIFGIATGGFMILGLLCIGGILAGTGSMDSLPWYLYTAFFGWLGTYIFYPIWTIWLGRNLLQLK